MLPLFDGDYTQKLDFGSRAELFRTMIREKIYKELGLYNISGEDLEMKSTPIKIQTDMSGDCGIVRDKFRAMPGHKCAEELNQKADPHLDISKIIFVEK
jgi:hypothetical protein